MRACGLRGCGWMLGCVLMVGGAGAQVPGAAPVLGAAPAASVAGVLRGMAARAGVVFVGQVQRIVPRAGVVEVTFLVQQPVLGVVGGTYVMREWAGRWTGGQRHYWVGERAMFFLHAAGGAAGDGGVGLSSPVDGMMGVVPVVPMGAGAGAGALLDVRWLAARVQRAVGAPMVDAATGGMALSDAVRVVARWQSSPEMEPERVVLPVGVRAELAVKPLVGRSMVLLPEPNDVQ
jgi:hypothetical protein